MSPVLKVVDENGWNGWKKIEFQGLNLSLDKSCVMWRMRVTLGTRNHSPQNLANRPTGALAFLIPCRPPFWSRGCSAQGHGWKCHCCFAVVFLSLSKQHGYNYCRPSSAHARGWLSCTHARTQCVCACVRVLLQRLWVGCVDFSGERRLTNQSFYNSVKFSSR